MLLVSNTLLPFEFCFVARVQTVVSIQFLTPAYELSQSVEISSEIVGDEIADFFEFETNISLKINNANHANKTIIIIFPKARTSLKRLINPFCALRLGFKYSVLIGFGLGACVTSSRLSIKHCIQPLSLKLI